VSRPLAIDLFTGIHGWAEGCIAEGFHVIGFDIEDMSATLGLPKPDHFSLVLQDVLTLHGSQFKDASLICASPPCQAYSYMAMPWSLAKAKAKAIRADETGAELERLNRLFEACFRIQREASEAAGRHIPMIVENVKGAQPWVGRARWAFGSYFLWGDVPALMPIQRYHQRQKVKAGEQWNINRSNFTGTRGWDEGLKNPGFRFDGSGRSFQTASVEAHVAEGRKNGGGSWFNIGSPGQKETNQNPVHGLVAARADRHQEEGIKQGGTWFHDATSASRTSSSKSPARKAASAKIAKIPLPLARHIAAVYRP